MANEHGMNSALEESSQVSSTACWGQPRMTLL